MALSILFNIFKVAKAGSKLVPLFLALSLPLTYVNYSNDKVESDEQFDFSANDIKDDIVLDGEKDEAYSPVALEFGHKTNGAFDVKLFLYHGKNALYMFFDVSDKYVTKRAIGSNNAQDEDGVEIMIDSRLNGGASPQTDDFKIHIGVSGFTKVLKGTGAKWGTTEVGFGGMLVSKLKPNTTPNYNDDIDEGYNLEYCFPYSCLYGDANIDTPFGICFVHSTLDNVLANRGRTGMSNQPTYKVSSADLPSAYPVLTKDNSFHIRKEFGSVTSVSPTVLGRVTDKANKPLSNAKVTGYYSSSPQIVYERNTDESGYFYYEDIKMNNNRFDNFVVKVNKYGYLASTLVYDSENLAEANGGDYYQEFILLNQDIETINATGKVSASGLNNLAGFTVSLLGHDNVKTITDSSGNYTLPIYKGIENTLIIEKSGYEKAFEKVSEDNLDNETEMIKQITLLAKPVSRTLIHNYANAGITRTDSKVYLKVSSPYIIRDDEVLSLYLNTGEKSSFGGEFANGDYRIDYTNNKAEVYSFNEESGEFSLIPNSSEVIKSTTTLRVLYETLITIPNSIINLDSSKTFGAAINFYDGENYQGNYIGTSVAKDGELDPLSTATYLRFDNKGTVYFANNNVNTNLLYYYHAVDGPVNEDIPNNADRVYMTYTRDETGLEMDVIVSGNFSKHFNTSTSITGVEAINLILNLDGVDCSNWLLNNKNNICYDINFRIYSDDTICYINSTDVKTKGTDQLWWSDANHNNTVAKNFTLQSHQVSESNYEIEKYAGYSVYKLRFTYEELLTLGDAPNSATLDKDSPISALLFEVSETSKTTIRFYTTTGGAWVFENKKIKQTIGVLSAQSSYVALAKNK